MRKLKKYESENENNDDEEVGKISLAAVQDERRLAQKRHALHACDLKALPAADILADHHVVAAKHIGLRLGKLRAVPVVGAGRQILFLGTHQPLDFILSRLMAMRAIQGRRLLIRPLVKKFALIHEVRSRVSVLSSQ